MKTLFDDNSSFDLVSLYDLGSRYLTEGEEQIKVVGFQRNAVWKEDKVEALWDSILSGFPIGSILLARQQDYWDLGTRSVQVSRDNASEDTIIDEKGTGFIVVDGQQRLNSIAQGFINFDERLSCSRLWIDLAEPSNPEQRQFEFYFCTSSNPFGVNGPEVLTKDEKRRALLSIENENADDSDLSLNKTYPYKAKLPVPFYEFWNVVQGKFSNGSKHVNFRDFPSLFSSVDWHLSKEVANILLKKSQNVKIRNIEGDLFDPICRTVLSGGLDSNYQVPVILIQKNDPKRLGKLFERVNINGEVPPQAELFFSALKLRYPPINNYVSHVYNDEKLKHLLRPTDIVLSALRLADPSVSRLELNRFDKLTKDNSEKLISLMEHQDDRPSRFKECLTIVYGALHYNKYTNDIGLPRQLIRTLRPRVFQTLLIWTLNHFEEIQESGIQPTDRLNFIRYAIFDSLNYFIEWKPRLSTYINSPTFVTLPVHADLTNAQFPALGIIKRVKEKVDQDGYALKFFLPPSYDAWINNSPDPNLPTWNQLGNEQTILMYAQRNALTDWEKYRLDIDHIVPSHWMVFKAGPLSEGVFWKVPIKSYYRYEVLHRTGNYRFWPDSLNRAYGDCSPKQKFIQWPIGEPLNEKRHVDMGLNTDRDILAASAIEPDEAKQMQELSEGSPKNWTPDRFAMFKKVVYYRRYRMYKQMFEALQLNEWAEAIQNN